MLIRIFMSIEEHEHRAAMKPCAMWKWFCGQSWVMLCTVAECVCVCVCAAVV